MEDRTRRKLLVGTGLLIVMQVAHLLDVLRYSETAEFPGVLADPLGALGVGAAGAAFCWTVQRQRLARAGSLAAGSAISLGFILQHGLPFDLAGVNNPYWTLDGNRADLLRWATVVVLIGLGLWTAWTAWAGEAADHPDTLSFETR